MQPRMKDIARDLGLSVMTISKVLRNHPDISEETRKRVLQRMSELNYRPNLAARSLITGRSSMIGLVVPDLLHPFFAQVANAVSGEIRKHGYGLIISSSDEDPELEQQEIEQLLARQVDVIIVASAQRTTESFRRIEELKVPYILLDRRIAGLDANFVGVDDRKVGMIATTHLIEQGCTRVAHIRGPEVSTAIGRMDGYREALAAHQLVPIAGHVVSIGTSGDYRGERGGYDAAKRLLKVDPRPDGIFCFNDPASLGAMRAILEENLRIPEDIAIVGCGNLSYSDLLRVSLSSIDQASNSIGLSVASLAILLAESKGSRPTRTELIRPRLVVRASSQRTLST